MLPPHLQPHEVVVVRPSASTDAYGTNWDYGSSASRATIPGWLQQNQQTETFTEGRDILEQRWLLVTNHSDIDGNDRIEWDGHPAGGTMIFTVDGPPEPAYTPRGLHHLEATLRQVEG